VVTTCKPLGFGLCEGDVGPVQRAKIRRAESGRPNIPSGERRYGNPNLHRSDTGDIQAILVDLGDQNLIASSQYWREDRQAPPVRPELGTIVEHLHFIQELREMNAGYSRERLTSLLQRHQRVTPTASALRLSYWFRAPGAECSTGPVTSTTSPARRYWKGAWIPRTCRDSIVNFTRRGPT
jgi:hypothetical protein